MYARAGPNATEPAAPHVEPARPAKLGKATGRKPAG